MKKFSILLLIYFCFAGHIFAAVDVNKNDVSLSDSDAKYNYYIGQYYYSKGNYDMAETYFQRSRNMMEQKNISSGGRSVAGASVKANASGSLDYTISDGDILWISAWQNEDLNQEVIVRPDGKISFPLVGEIQAVGLTLTQLTQELTSGLKEFIKFPEISISIRKFGGSKVIIMGQVGHPGVYAVSGQKTLIEAIALAGGFAPDAVTKSIILIRGGLQNPKAERLNLRDAIIGRNMTGNIALQSEDIIYVPKSFISNASESLSKIMDIVSRGSMSYNIVSEVGRQAGV